MEKKIKLLGKLIFITFVFAMAYGFTTFGYGQEKLVVWIGGHAVEEEETWAEMVKEFEQKTGADVEYQLIGFDVYYDKLVVAFEAGQPPDLCHADLGGWVPTFAAQGWLEPMEDYLAGWEGTKQMWPNLWDTVVYKGVRYGVPWYTDDRALLYNTRMLANAGLDPARPPKYWWELLGMAMKLTQPEKKIYGYGVSGKMSEVNTLGYMMFLYGAGGDLLTPDYGKAAFNTPEGLNALRFYTELFTEYGVSPPGTANYGEDDYRSMMAMDKVAMAIGGPWSFPLIEMANPAIKGNYAVSIHPYQKEAASVLGGWASVIAKKSTKKDLAKEFISHITSYDAWMTWIERHGGPMPTRKDVCFAAPTLKDPKWRVILDTFPYAKIRAPIPVWPQVSTKIQEMVQNLILKKMSAKQAIDKAEREINAILAR